MGPNTGTFVVPPYPSLAVTVKVSVLLTLEGAVGDDGV